MSSNTTPISESDAGSVRSGSRFGTTRWSIVRAAGENATVVAKEALGRLAEHYWFPIYSYLRRLGADREEAKDLTQTLFTRFFEHRKLGQISIEGGRFRSYLMASAKNLWIAERQKQQTQKRGGGEPHLSLDWSSPDWEEGESRFLNEPYHEITPEHCFDHQWARSTLTRTGERLRESYDRDEKIELYDALHLTLTGDLPSHELAEVCERLKMTPGNIRVCIHRMRRRFGSLLRDEISQTLETPTEVDDELSHLLEILSSPSLEN